MSKTKKPLNNKTTPQQPTATRPAQPPPNAMAPYENPEDNTVWVKLEELEHELTIFNFTLTNHYATLAKNLSLWYVPVLQHHLKGKTEGQKLTAEEHDQVNVCIENITKSNNIPKPLILPQTKYLLHESLPVYPKPDDYTAEEQDRRKQDENKRYLELQKTSANCHFPLNYTHHVVNLAYRDLEDVTKHIFLMYEEILKHLFKIDAISTSHEELRLKRKAVTRDANKILDVVEVTKKYAKGYVELLQPLSKYARFISYAEERVGPNAGKKKGKGGKEEKEKSGCEIL